MRKKFKFKIAQEVIRAVKTIRKKKCGNCGEKKYFTQFTKNCSNKDGLEKHCFLCENKERRLNVR